jgi:hypothetical protein
MTSARALLSLAAALGLAACADSRPPIAGADPGPGSPAIQQRIAEQPHSAPVSQGTPSFTGATGSGGGQGAGRPEITYGGPGTGTLGGVPPQPRLPVFRP